MQAEVLKKKGEIPNVQVYMTRVFCIFTAQTKNRFQVNCQFPDRPPLPGLLLLLSFKSKCLAVGISLLELPNDCPQPPAGPCFLVFKKGKQGQEHLLNLVSFQPSTKIKLQLHTSIDPWRCTQRLYFLIFLAFG